LKPVDKKPKNYRQQCDFQRCISLSGLIFCSGGKPVLAVPVGQYPDAALNAHDMNDNRHNSQGG
jgi:hypothetical protein